MAARGDVEYRAAPVGACASECGLDASFTRALDATALVGCVLDARTSEVVWTSARAQALFGPSIELFECLAPAEREAFEMAIEAACHDGSARVIA